MPVTLGARPEHGFDQPLGLLSDCHRRIENFLGILERVAADCRGGALTDQHRRAAETALRYFDTAGPRHTADEEQSLFPRLRQLDRPDVQEAMQKLAELEADHARAEVLHREVGSLFRRWLDSGRLTNPEAQSLEGALLELHEMYARHIGVEDREIFPLAGAALEPDQLIRVGREMAERRGLPV